MCLSYIPKGLLPSIRAFAGHVPGPGIRLVLMILLGLPWLTRTQAATRIWDGGGDGVSWTDPSNWSDDAVPGELDDAVIDLPGTNATIRCIGPDITLRSLRCEEAIDIRVSLFTLTDGVSRLNGGATLRNTLRASGSNTWVIGQGVTNVNFSGLIAIGGARLDLPAVRQASQNVVSGSGLRLWQALGEGSVVSLPALTNMGGYTDSFRGPGFVAEARDAGRIDLSALRSVTGGDLTFRAAGTGSVVNLESLTEAGGAVGFVHLSATNQGTLVLSPGLQDAGRVQIDLSAGGSLSVPVTQFRALNTFTADAGEWTLPGLTSLTVDGGINASGSNTLVNLPGLISVDRAGLVASNGGRIRLPGLVVATNNIGANRWRAVGDGSSVEFPALTGMEGSGSHVVEAAQGGRILLSSLTRFASASIVFVADGSNSTVVLPALTNLSQVTAFARFSVSNDARIVLSPALTGTPTMQIELSNGGTLSVPVSQFSFLRRFYTDSGAWVIPSLASLPFNASIELSGSNTLLTLPGLTNIDTATLKVLDGAHLILPAVPRVARGSLSWLASGQGSTIDLENVTNLTTISSTFLIQAIAGGRVLLPNATRILNGSLGMIADGVGSVIDLRSLVDVGGPTGTVTLTASNNGQILLSPLFNDGTRVQVTLDTGGTLSIPVTQLRALNSITLGSGTWEFPLLTGLPSTAAIRISGTNTVVSLPALTNLNGVTLGVSAGAHLLIPAVKQFEMVGAGHNWIVTGPGSQLSMPGLTNLAGSGSMQIGVFDGAQLQFPKLGQLRTSGSGVTFYTTGNNSLLELESLTDLGLDGSTTFWAAQGGEIVLSHGLHEAARADFWLEDGGIIPIADLISIRSLRLIRDDGLWTLPLLATVSPGGEITAVGENTEVVLPSLTVLNGVDVRASDGARIAMPGVTNGFVDIKTRGESSAWSAIGVGSELEMPGLLSLTGVTNNTGFRLEVSAEQGGLVHMTNLTSIVNGAVRLNAEGSGSLLDAGALADLGGPGQAVDIEIHQGAQLRLSPLLKQAVRANFTIDSAVDLVPLPQSLLSVGSFQVIDAGNWSLPLVTNVARGARLSASGSGTVLSLPSVMMLDAVGLGASGGAILALSAATTATNLEGRFDSGKDWSARDKGSILDLPALKSLSRSPSASSGSQFGIQAGLGGQVQLPALERFVVSVISVKAWESNSIISLPSLSDLGTPRGGAIGVSFEALSGATLTIGPGLKDGSTASFTLRGGGSMPIQDLRAIGGLTLDRNQWVLSGVTNIAPNRAVSIEGSNTVVEFPALARLDSVAVAALSGARVSLSAVLNASDTASQGFTRLSLVANGAGTLLELPALTNVAGLVGTPGAGSYSRITAVAGGRVAMPGVVKAGGNISCLSDGSGSVVDLHSLTDLGPTGGHEYVASNGGQILLASLKNATKASIELRSGGFMPVTQLERIGSFLSDSGSWDFSQLKSVASGGSLTVQGSSTVMNFPLITNLDRIALTVKDGVLLLPAVGSVTNSQSIWHAEGTGAALVLPALTNLGPGSIPRVEALSGAQVLLTNLNTIRGASTFLAFGTGSVLHLESLTSLLPGLNGNPSTFSAKFAGQVLVPALRDAARGAFELLGGGFIPVEQVRQMDSFTADAGAWSLPALTSLRTNGTLSVSGPAVVSLPALSTLDGVSIKVLTGARLVLPAITAVERRFPTRTATGITDTSWQVNGAGSVLEVPFLNRIANNAVGAFTVAALSQGTVLLSNVTTLSGAAITLQAQGTGSVVNLLGLQQGPANPAALTVTEQTGGRVLLPTPVDFVVTGIVAPVAAAAGTIVPISWTVRNQGTVDTTRPRSDGVYLSQDSVFGNADDLFLGHFRAGPLAAASDQSVTNGVLIPPGLSGSFHVVVMADSQLEHYEAKAEGNNVFIAPGSIGISSADLVTVRLSPSTNSVTAGAALQVEWVVRNQGTAAAPAAWTDAIELVSNTGVRRRLASPPAPAGLGAGGEYTNRTTVSVPLSSDFPAGSATLVVIADAGGNQPESNDANNQATAPLTLNQPPLPDLLIAELKAPAIVNPGTAAVLTLVVTNQGSVAADGGWQAEIRHTLGGLTNRNLLATADTGVIGTFIVSNAISAGGWLSLTQSVQLPADFAATQAVFAVALDSTGLISETNEANNLAFAVATTVIPATLTISGAVTEVAEDAGSFNVVVTRSGDRGAPLQVQAIGALGRLISPGTASIPPGGAQVNLALDVVRLPLDFEDAVETLTATAVAGGYRSEPASVLIRNVDIPRLSLAPVSASLTEGQSTLVTLTREGPTASPLVVTLGSSSGANLVVPGRVTFAVGTQQATFTAIAADDAVIESAVDYTLTADAIGFSSASTRIHVVDNDLPSLIFRLDAPQVSEGAGPTGLYGTVERSTNGASFGRSLTLTVESSDTGTVVAPARVHMAANVAGVRFPISPVDNAMVDGSRLVTLTTRVLDGSGLALGAAAATNLTVLDDDGPALFLTLASEVVAEGRSPATTATLRRNTPATNALVVALKSGDTREATVPATVTLAIGQDSTIFPVASVADGVKDGSQRVAISASVQGFSTGSAVLTVSDQDLPDLVVRNVVVPASGFTEAYFSVGYAVRNIGLASMPTNAVIQLRYFLSRDSLPGGDRIAETPVPVELSGPLAPGQQISQSISLRAPREPGNWWVVVEADAGGNAVLESDEANNTGVSASPIHVAPAYDATVAADVQSAPVGTPVALRGNVTSLAPGLGSEGLPVTLYVEGGGFRRTLTALADATGHFRATFQPFPNEGGEYQVSAAHPGNPAPEGPQDAFTLYGLRAEPAQLGLRVSEAGETLASLTLRNLSHIALTGLHATVIGVSRDLSVKAVLEATLAGDTTALLNVTATAADRSAGRRAVTVRITGDSGVVLDIPVDIEVMPRTPRLVAVPSELQAGMRRGLQTAVEFEIRNDGSAPSGPLGITVPSLPWIHAASPNPLPSLQPGESTRITLLLSPGADVPLLEYAGAVAVNGTFGGVAVPFRFRALSDAVGSLEITAVSELTFYGEGSPRVTNAIVTLSDGITRNTVLTAPVGTDGRLLVPALREGYYELAVSAPDHVGYRAIVFVAGGRANSHEAFLSRQTVQYVWTVEPAEFEDHYTLEVRSTFETVVPIPRLLVSPAMIDLTALNVSGALPVQVDLVITNDGLVAAQDARLTFPVHPCWEIKPMVENLGTLPALGSVTVPVSIRRTGTADCQPCQFEAAVRWTLLCANRTNNYATSIPVVNAGAQCRTEPLVLGAGEGQGGEIPPGGQAPAPTAFFVPPTLVEAPPCNCAARVRLQVDQDAVVARDAFRATLDVANHTLGQLEEVGVSVTVTTETGEDATSRFDVRPDGLAGLSAVDGSGVIDALSTGQARFILVPTEDAAPLSETAYLVSGTLRYTEAGVPIAIPLAAVRIRVLPNPRLLVKYYWQRDVLGDDPFTLEREPSVPFPLAMMIENLGHGTARKVRVTSGQPRIIGNEDGLLVSFDLFASQLEGQDTTPSFTLDFGEIKPGQTRIATWFLRSGLQGFFDQFEASVEHNDALGQFKHALFDPPQAYQLIHLVRATGPGNDERTDFLVNQGQDSAGLPDALHLSDGRVEPVAVVLGNMVASAVDQGHLTSALTTPLPGAGYCYLRLPDPQGLHGSRAFRLSAVQRPDGTFLPGENFWQTDRTFTGRGQRPVRENLVHLFDRNPTGQYTLIYEPAQPPDTTPPSSAVALLPPSSPGAIPLNWSGADTSGIASYDIFVSEDNGAFTAWLAGTPDTSALYPGRPGHTYSFYSVATDSLGNRESPPGVPDAMTTTDFINSPPVSQAPVQVSIDEGDSVAVELTADDPDAPVQSLTWTLLSGPAGMTLSPVTGELRWATGEANGPSTTTVLYMVCDNYAPSACVTQAIQVVVRELNTRPEVAAVTNRAIAEGSRLVVSNRATDADLPLQVIRWSKGAGFPPNATLDPVTGVFDWRPSDTQGPSTNIITVVATDNGTPPLSGTQTFTVIVRDSSPDFRLTLGATNLLGGETASVSVDLNGEPSLGRVRFGLELPPGRLDGLALVDRSPDLTSAVITELDSGKYSLQFEFSGNNASAKRTLARLAFHALPDGPSALLPLHIPGIVGTRLGGIPVGNAAAVDGEAIVITTSPVITTHQTPRGTFAIFGVPGQPYLIEKAPTLEGPWGTWEQVHPAGRVERRQIELNASQQFYRAR